MPISRPQIMLALVAVALVVGVVGGAWLHYHTLVERWTQIDRLETELARASISPDELEALAREVRDQQRQLEHLQALVPPEAEIGSLLEQLGEQLAQAETADRQLATGTATASPAFGQTPLTLSFRSSYRGLWHVLRGIERDRRILRPAKLVVRYRDRAPEQPLAVELALTTFTQPSDTRLETQR